MYMRTELNLSATNFVSGRPIGDGHFWGVVTMAIWDVCNLPEIINFCASSMTPAIFVTFHRRLTFQKCDRCGRKKIIRNHAKTIVPCRNSVGSGQIIIRNHAKTIVPSCTESQLGTIKIWLMYNTILLTSSIWRWSYDTSYDDHVTMSFLSCDLSHDRNLEFGMWNLSSVGQVLWKVHEISPFFAAALQRQCGETLISVG